jgi:hypothetical protein
MAQKFQNHFISKVNKPQFSRLTPKQKLQKNKAYLKRRLLRLLKRAN